MAEWTVAYVPDEFELERQGRSQARWLRQQVALHQLVSTPLVLLAIGALLGVAGGGWGAFALLASAATLIFLSGLIFLSVSKRVLGTRGSAARTAGIAVPVEVFIGDDGPSRRASNGSASVGWDDVAVFERTGTHLVLERPGRLMFLPPETFLLPARAFPSARDFEACAEFVAARVPSGERSRSAGAG